MSGEHTPGTEAFGIPHTCAPAWRRGAMMAVEAMDTLVNPRMPIKKKDADQTIERIRALLNEIVEYTQGSSPATYSHAFEMSEAFCADQRRKRDEDKRALIAKATTQSEVG